MIKSVFSTGCCRYRKHDTFGLFARNSQQMRCVRNSAAERIAGAPTEHARQLLPREPKKRVL
uniref:Uncharacterized protein n=1 Tax=Anguilla anguilla TaxID=7936 RepID=A0A0E9PV90_ANGAN